jgi:hypothetical protein
MKSRPMSLERLKDTPPHDHSRVDSGGRSIIISVHNLMHFEIDIGGRGRWITGEMADESG